MKEPVEQPESRRRSTVPRLDRARTRARLIGEALAAAGRALLPEAAVGKRPRTIMFVAWPEPGHVASPVALARELAARGDRVVFATPPHFGQHIRALGFQHVDLAGRPDRRHPWSLFGPMPMPGRAALGDAVDQFLATFRAAVERHRPSLVLIDTLYSAFALAAAAAGVRWALYESDLPRELDPEVPPPRLQVAPDGTAPAREAIRVAWDEEIRRARAARAVADVSGVPFDWSRPYFPAALVEELERRLGALVAFNPLVRYAPLARGPRLVFCPPELDFARTRSAQGRWVGPYIDHQRTEPAFPWEALPRGVPIVYCAFGTQSLRNAQAAARIRTVVEVFARRDDAFLVLACPAVHRPPALGGPGRMLVVERAPQLALLSRASLAITHAGFNSVKECAAFGVPMLALPLSHDQPRNAALVQHRGLGVALPGDRVVTSAALDRAVDELRASNEIAAGCARMKRVFSAWAGRREAVAFVDDLLVGRPGHP